MHPSVYLAILALDPHPVAVTWPLIGLSPELDTIAYQESYYGKYLDHEPHARGPYHTAFGSLGLKGSTAHDVYLRSKWLMAKMPGLADKWAFLNRFWHNSELYMHCANLYWATLRRLTPSIGRAVFAWRWGLTASNMATNEKIESDSYTVKYINRMETLSTYGQ